jgi:hypothetical protein
MAHHRDMTAAGDGRTLLKRLSEIIDGLPASLRQVKDAELGEPLIQIHEAVDRLEAVFAGGLSRFDKSGDFKADGALSAVAWLRWRCKLSGGAAAERVNLARQLEQLPETRKAFARGEVGYQHVAMLARTAENIGANAVRQQEATLLQAARTMDPGQFASVARGFEYQVDQAAALTEANRAYVRRYLHLSEPNNGLVHLEGLLDAEGGATLKTVLHALMPPQKKDDDRTPGQRRADALVDLCHERLNGRRLGHVGGQRPHLVITASAETLAGSPGAPPAELAGVGPIPIETAQRHACDASVSLILARGELDREVGHASQKIPPATRRALVARDRGCVVNGCQRPPAWCDGHHVVWWTRGGRTELSNLALVCGRHHRMVHEDGWALARKDGRWVTTPPASRVAPHARSA